MDVQVTNMRSNEFESELMDSVFDTGFAVLTHHGVDKSLIEDMQSGWREFFLQPLSLKNEFINHQDANLGYKGFKSETAVGYKTADLKEFFHYKMGKAIPPELATVTQMMYSQLEDVGMQVLSVFNKHNQTHLDFKRSCVESDNTLLRTLYYPALDFSTEPGAVRAAAHEDINFITMLVAASSPGLQVLDSKNRWHDVPHEDNSIVLNVGDMLQLATHGTYKSTTHRVINPENNTSDRVSTPLFIHPHSDVLLTDGVTAQQYLNERIAQIYGTK